ncbi:MAG: stage III sporulation protein D [Clostridiales bacterium]|nr:stage III sporulation protein D [Clostridiales bacterium]
MKENIDERAVELANYIIENKSTVRATAQKFGISKSTVHKDLTERLYYADRSLFYRVKELLEFNKSQRHIRGVLATRKKFKGE